LSSSGVLNPIRQLATVRTMSTRELRLVTSDGVTAQYQAEAPKRSTTRPRSPSRSSPRSAARASCRSAGSSTRIGRASPRS
jgi:hypothetical protein